MSETLYRQRPDDSIAALPLELADDFRLWEDELRGGLEEVAEVQIDRLMGNEAEGVSLKEQYNLPFEPMETVRGVGSVALAMAVRQEQGSSLLQGDQGNFEDIAQEAMTDIDSPENKEQRGGGVFAQEMPEYQEFVSQAQSIIYNLRYGDQSGLGALPPEFQDSLSVRMDVRLAELEKREISDGEFGLEIKKMISVACVGLGKISKPELG